jgi:hypothetical protein
LEDHRSARAAWQETIGGLLLIRRRKGRKESKSFSSSSSFFFFFFFFFPAFSLSQFLPSASSSMASLLHHFLILLLLCFSFTLSFSSSVSSSSSHIDYTPQDLASESHLRRLFDRWLLHHSKNHTSSGPRTSERFQTFKENLFYIHNHNNRRDPLPYRLGLNRFADLTLEEFRSKYLGFGFGSGTSGILRKHESEYVGNTCDRLPHRVDWRDHGAVTPVKDQGQCGAFLAPTLNFELLTVNT